MNWYSEIIEQQKKFFSNTEYSIQKSYHSVIKGKKTFSDK